MRLLRLSLEASVVGKRCVGRGLKTDERVEESVEVAEDVFANGWLHVCVIMLIITS
jgi:hypothetical protein